MYLPDYEGLMGSGDQVTSVWLVKDKVSRQRHLGNTLKLLSRSECFSNGSKMNKSVSEITDFGPTHIFAGPLPVIKKDGQREGEVEAKHLRFLDMRMRDYCDTIDWFVQMGHVKPPVRTTLIDACIPPGPNQSVIKAVRINCEALEDAMLTEIE